MVGLWFCSMSHGKYASLLVCSWLFLLKIMWKESYGIFSYMICVFLALWWEWIHTYQTYQKMLNISKREKKWSWHAEPRLSINHFQKESEFVFMNKTKHKRVVSLFLPGSTSWPVTKFLYSFYLRLLWLSFHLHMLYELVHAEYIILISSWSWLINNCFSYPKSMTVTEKITCTCFPSLHHLRETSLSWKCSTVTLYNTLDMKWIIMCNFSEMKVHRATMTLANISAVEQFSSEQLCFWQCPEKIRYKFYY